MANDTEKLRELLERVEKVSEPHREIDIALAMALTNPRRSIAWNHFQNMRPKGSPERTEVEFWEKRAPAYTASLDASIALVERMLPGWKWVAGANDDNDECICIVGNRSSNEVGDDFEGIASTVPLAVLCSLLRALISQAESSTLRDGLTRAEAHKTEGGSGLSSCPLQAEGEAQHG